MNDTPPGPRGLPVIGNTHQWVRDPCAFRERCAKQYGPVVNYEIIGMDAYMLTNPNDIERVLVSEQEKFPKHQASSNQLRGTIGNGLVTSEGALWERQREAIEPAFYMSHIKRYADIMVNQTMKRMTDWEAGDSLDMKQEMMHLTLDILVEAMFGRDIDTDGRDIYAAVEALEAPLEPRKQPITFMAPDWLPVPFLRRAQEALTHLDEQIYDIITDRRRKDENRDDLLSMLLEADTEMSDEQIRDEMVTFLFAGHETTALTLTYIWDLLTRNPTTETHLHQELDETLAGDTPTVTDFSAFDYTENIVKEAMRLYPPAHEIRREPIEDITIDGYTIPKRSLITLPTWVMHHDERFWDDPEMFSPDRWETTTERPDFAYFPFGGGSRRCIGQQFAMTEAQLIVATIAQEFAFDRQYEDLALSAAVTLQPKGAVEMVPQPR